MTTTYVLDALRTPFGRYGGAYARTRPDDLGALVMQGLLERRPELDPAEVDDVVFGCANQSGEDNRNVGRMSWLLAGLPSSVPAATVNRLCGSGMEAVAAASRLIASGDAQIVVAGGVESMTRAPWVIAKPDRGFPVTAPEVATTTIGWRLVNPKMPAEWTVALGEGAELLAERYRISREQQDAFALSSHRKAAAAWDAGLFAEEAVLVDGTGLERDECLRPESSLEALAKLKAAFRIDGSVTAGNASPLNDGAAALLLASEDAASRLGCEPLGRVVSRAVSALEPQWFGLGPVEASKKALKAAGIGWGDLKLVELNEAFAAQSLACLAELPDLDPEIVNVNGGAVAIGHPLGASGARLVGTALRELRRRGGGFGLCALCIGVGQGIAMVLEG